MENLSMKEMMEQASFIAPKKNEVDRHLKGRSGFESSGFDVLIVRTFI